MKKTIEQLLGILQKPATSAKESSVVPQRHYAARSPSQRMGERGEQIARHYLMQQGLRYVDSNVASKLGEIDLIMQEGAVLVFVEVKMRRSDAYGGAASAITPSKLVRLRHAIELYLQQHPQYAQNDCRMDAVLIQSSAGAHHIEWLRNIDAD